MKPRSTLILVREWEQQMSSSGCCSRLEGDFLLQRGNAVFPERRAGMESMGPLYRAIRAHFGERVELQVVDPRNLMTLVVLLVRDCRRMGFGIGEAFRTLSSIPVQGVIVNGRIFAHGAWPAADELLDHLEREMGEPLAPTG
jgi:hypothetical protein